MIFDYLLLFLVLRLIISTDIPDIGSDDDMMDMPLEIDKDVNVLSWQNLMGIIATKESEILEILQFHGFYYLDETQLHTFELIQAIFSHTNGINYFAKIHVVDDKFAHLWIYFDPVTNASSIQGIQYERSKNSKLTAFQNDMFQHISADTDTYDLAESMNSLDLLHDSYDLQVRVVDEVVVNIREDINPVTWNRAQAIALILRNEVLNTLRENGFLFNKNDTEYPFTLVELKSPQVCYISNYFYFGL